MQFDTKHIQTLNNWEFRRSEENVWRAVTLPHTPFEADLNGQEAWFGQCRYRRLLQIENPREGERYALHLGAAMHSMQVWVDGSHCDAHSGGYLPFECDLSEMLADGESHLVELVLDNTDNADVPPGKPYGELDFCWYGGLYRHAELRRYPPFHFTDSVAANALAGGGVFVRTLSCSNEVARLYLQAQVVNELSSEFPFKLRFTLQDMNGRECFTESLIGSLQGEGREDVSVEIDVPNPRLWSPADPQLYKLQVEVSVMDGPVLHSAMETFGIRTLEMSRSGGLVINGKRIRPRGTNRHQDHPYVGYALPDAAQWRDARRIKEAGFDYVRLSHYPQSPAFYDACDYYGILVMNCIPGWQYLGDKAFRDACYRNARELVRRDRNHPSVILWELSLNETFMDDEFIQTLHGIGHEEYPGGQMFTCGWMEGFDVYIRARQHGKLHSWQNGDQALVVSEYGDWEYYAGNDGFDQKTGTGLNDPSKNSRAFRGDGEAKLRQQLLNHIEALSDTLSSPAIVDGQWCMFDYPRGYHPQQAACGVMDFFRLPKWSYHFYRSQRDVDEGGEGWTGGAVLEIATYWTAESDVELIVLSNLERVELKLNDRVLKEKPAPEGWKALPHPPRIFDAEGFKVGVLEAVGFVGERSVALTQVKTPQDASVLEIDVDRSCIKRVSGEDLVFVRVRVLDTLGSLCVGFDEEIGIESSEGGRIVGPSSINAEAGIASFLLSIPAGSEGCKLIARGAKLPEAGICI